LPVDHEQGPGVAQADSDWFSELEGVLWNASERLSPRGSRVSFRKIPVDIGATKCDV